MGFLLGIGTGTATAQPYACPAVVELFTAQGCASCARALELAPGLAARRDMLFLSYHVAYWDYIGWRDPFATAETTQRQRAYAHMQERHYVSTPQFILDGTRSVDESAVIQPQAPRRCLVPVAGVANAAGVTVHVPAETLPPQDTPPSSRPDSVWIVGYDTARSTLVTAGENRGRILRDYHVVRFLRRLGSYDGRAATYRLEPGELRGEHAALLVQDPLMRVIGVGRLTLGPEAAKAERSPTP